MSDVRMTLAINRCPKHGFYAVTIDGEHSGTRVTPSKCCGQWDTRRAWSLSYEQWRELARLANEAADAEERRLHIPVPAEERR